MLPALKVQFAPGLGCSEPLKRGEILVKIQTKLKSKEILSFLGWVEDASNVDAVIDIAIRLTACINYVNVR